MNSDFVDLIRCLLAAEARFLVVGGYAVAVHGHPRATKDLDVWVEPSLANATAVLRALTAFGAPMEGLDARTLATPHYGFMMGRPPRRIDVLNVVDGLDFGPAWERRLEHEVEPGLIAPFLGLQDLLRNKRASGRPQDLADVATLEKLASPSQ